MGLRSLLIAGLLLLPLAARAQPAAPDATAKAPTTTPAPVPSIPPGTPQTGAPSVPPEVVAPAAPPGGATSDSGPSNATPFSGPPTTLAPGTERQSPDTTRGSNPAAPMSR
jgi:hypothetical protein